MYEVGRYIGKGLRSYFFRLRKYPRIGVKIFKESPARNEKEEKKRLLIELAAGKYLRDLGISVPRYLGVVKVKFPDYFADIWERKNPGLVDYGLSKLTGKVKWGLLMEVIENDLSLISKERINYYYKKECEKIENLGIKVSEEPHNVLWSQNKKRLYFIDFSKWIFPINLERYLLKKRLKDLFLKRKIKKSSFS